MRRSAIAVALLLLSSALSAQNIGPLPPLTAQVDVHVVNVDVTVTDMDGQPVMNLGKDDFEIFEDGKLQTVTNFSVVENAALRDGAIPTLNSTPAEFRRKVLLLVDNNYIEKNERNIALNKIEKYVTSSFGAEWAVAAIGQSASMVQTLTQEPVAIHAAFDRVRALPTFYSQHQIDRSILSDRTRRMIDLVTEYDYGETVRFNSREQTFRNLMTMQNTARAISDMARAHSADIGKKYIILLTGGMELNTSFSAFEKRGRDHELDELRRDISKTIDAMVRESNAAGFTVHVINARSRGMQAPQHDVENRSSGIDMSQLLRSGAGNDPIDVSDVDSAPLSLAIGTGGLYLPSNDVVASVERIDHQTSNFYSLGYSPAHQGDQKYHRIRVKVKRGGVRVANRTGYFDLTPEDRLREMLHARPALERNVGSLPVTIAVGTPHTSDRDMVVPVTAALSMDKVTLLPRDDGYVGRVHVYLSVFDNDGHNIAFQHQTQELTFPLNQLENAMGEAFRYTIKVHLRKGGAFTVMMTLRDELSNELGSAAKAIQL
jgi:VWFA-related protein